MGHTTRPLIVWRDVVSTNLERVGWLDGVGCFVRFKGESVYFYAGMTRQRAVAMVRAASPGGYFHRKVRGKYPTERIA